MRWTIKIGLGTIDNQAATWIETTETQEMGKLEAIEILNRAASEALELCIKRAQRLDPIIFVPGPTMGGSFFVRLRAGSIEMTAGPAEVSKMTLGSAAAAGQLAAQHALDVIRARN